MSAVRAALAVAATASASSGFVARAPGRAFASHHRGRSFRGRPALQGRRSRAAVEAEPVDAPVALNQTLQLEIETMTATGDGLARLDGCVVTRPCAYTATHSPSPPLPGTW